MRKDKFKLLCSIFKVNPNLAKGWIAALFSYLPGGTKLFAMLFEQERAVALIRNRHVQPHIGHSVAKKHTYIN